MVGRASRRRVDCCIQVCESLKYTIVGEGSGESGLIGVVVAVLRAADCSGGVSVESARLREP